MTGTRPQPEPPREPVEAEPAGERAPAPGAELVEPAGEPEPPRGAAPTAVTIKASPRATRGARERVREALTCPFCHDAVPSRGGALCARDGCGALYHHECWQECARDYGGCAVYGCGSRDARDLTPVGWLVRWLRLLTAALLFPPRVVRALREREGQSAREILKQANGEATAYLHARIPGFGKLLVLGLLGLWAALYLIDKAQRASGGFTPGNVKWILGLALALPLLAMFHPFLYAFGYVTAVLFGRRLSRALEGELAALRGGAGGYLSRIGKGGK